MDMVYQHTIPFGAPSQLRLLIAASQEGDAEVSVLDAFNQPIGNLRNMKAHINDLKAVVNTTTTPIEAKNDKAVCSLRMTDDPRKEDIEVRYEDLERNRAITATVTVEDFMQLIEELTKDRT
jgi:hypothetical protein